MKRFAPSFYPLPDIANTVQGVSILAELRALPAYPTNIDLISF